MLYPTSLALLLALSTPSCSRLSPTPPSSTTHELVRSEPSPEVEAQLTNTLNEARKLGKGNPLHLSSLFSLAAYYKEQNSYSKAEAVYRELLAMKETASGPNHQDLVVILEQLASLLRETNRSLEAELFTLRAKAIRTQHSFPEEGPIHPPLP